MQHLGKKRRRELFDNNLTVLKRLLKVTDTECSLVFRHKRIQKDLDEDTVRAVKESFEIWRQEDIQALKECLYMLDPTEDKKWYNTLAVKHIPEHFL